MAGLAAGAACQRRLSLIRFFRVIQRRCFILRQPKLWVYDNRLVRGRRRCQNCEMLRHLHVRESALALLGACVVLACSPAPPVEVGIDYVTPRLSENDAPPEPEVPPLEDDIPEGDEPVPESLLDFDD